MILDYPSPGGNSHQELRDAYLWAAASALVQARIPVSMPGDFKDALSVLRLAVCNCPWPEDAERSRHLIGCALEGVRH